jgi:hypothetical protein
LVFKAGRGDDLYLYYGNPDTGAPRYDLSLVTSELRAAQKLTARLSPGEVLKKESGWTAPDEGKTKVLFWGVLVLVVGGLLVIITRLLPQTSPAPPESPPAPPGPDQPTGT